MTERNGEIPGTAADAVSVRVVQGATRFVRTAAQVEGSRFSAVAWRALAALDRFAGPGSRISEIARQQRIAQPSATSLVHRLEAEGWVRRDADPHDGRASLVSITPTGSRALAAYRAAVAARISPLIAELPAEDRAALARAAELLDGLAARLEGEPFEDS